MTDTYTIVRGKAYIDKDPDAVLDYSRDWADWLEETDAIIGLEVIADAPLVVEQTVIQETVTVAMISGGTVGQTHQVTFRITTEAGRKEDRSIFLKIKER